MINIFIGSEPAQRDAERTLVSSLERHHDPADMNITVMRAGEGIWKDWVNHGPTGFTLFRFAIPELMDFKGFAIYLDCDMLVLDDIEDLEMCGQLGRWIKAQGEQGDCVSVIDCAACRGLLPSIADMKTGKWRKWDVRRFLQTIVHSGVPSAWNQYDDYFPGRTKLIHFTSLKHQPWFAHSDPHPSPEAVELWTKEWMSL